MNSTEVLVPARTSRPWLVLAAAAVGAIMVGLDGTAITIAAPYIARSVNASLTDLQVIANTYLVALTVGLLPAGRIADRCGRRATFIMGVLAFGVSSLAIALSDTVLALAVFRAVQGFAGALLQPAALALLRTAFDEKRMPVALGVWGGVNALALGLGPVIAGLIVQAFGWQAVFVVNLPVAVLATVLALSAVAESRGPGSKVFAGMRELLRQRTVAVSAAIIGFSSFGIFGLLFMLTLYLQNVHHLTPIETGMWLLAPTTLVVVSALVGGVLGDKLGTRWPMAAGLVLVAAGLYGVGSVSPDSGYWRLVLPAMAVGIGTGLCVVPATNALLAAARESLAGMASAVQQAASQFGGVLGIGVLGGALSFGVADALPGRLAAGDVPASIGDQVTAAIDQVSQGMMPGIDTGSFTVAVRTATQWAFTDGMGTALTIAAVVTLAGAVLASVLGTRRRTA